MAIEKIPNVADASDTTLASRRLATDDNRLEQGRDTIAAAEMMRVFAKML